jgi:hypothetical protein
MNYLQSGGNMNRLSGTELIRPRNFLVAPLRSRGHKVFRDKKKEFNKLRCRDSLQKEEEGDIMVFKILRTAKAGDITLLMCVEDGIYSFVLTTWQNYNNFSSGPSPSVNTLAEADEWFEFLKGNLMLQEEVEEENVAR